MRKRLPTVTLLTWSAFWLGGCGGEVAGPATEPESAVESEQISKAEPLVCNIFELITNTNASILKLSLRTDLPDDTNIIISVGRSYWQKGNSAEYTRPHFEQKSTVGEWREPHEIDIDSTGWTQNLKSFQAKMTRATLGFEVERISGDIDVRITVPRRQTNPSFGDRNKNLQGEAVTIESDGRFVHGETRLPYPL